MSKPAADDQLNPATGQQRVGKGLWYALGFSAVGIAVVLHGLLESGPTPSLRGIDWFLVGFGFIAQVIVWLAKAARMYFIAAGMKARIPLGRFFQIYLATCFMSHITPFNSGGTPLQVYLIKQQGVSLGKATAITTVDLGLNTFFYGLLIPIAVVVSWQTGQAGLPKAGRNWGQWLGIGFGALLVVGSLVWIAGNWSRFGWTRRIHAAMTKRGWFRNMMREWDRFKEGWRLLIQEHPIAIVGASLATVAYWLFYLLLAPLIIWALGREASFLKLIGIQLIYNFAQLLVPTPGGSGGSEVILSYLFRGICGPGQIAIFVLIWRGYTYFSSLIFGGIFFWRLSVNHKRRSKD